MTYKFIIVFLIYCCFNFKLSAQEYSREEIQKRVEAHAIAIYPKNSNEEIHAKATPIDSRKKIKPCEKELSITAPNFSNFTRNVTTRVRCLDKKGWSLYVSARISILTPVVVADSTIEKGDAISSGAAKVAMFDKSYARKGHISTLNKVIGSKAKRQISAGQPIMNSSLCFVCKEELVTIEAKTKNLTVKTSGYALSDGSFGDVISIRNTSSKRVVHGRVVGVGKVEISL